MYVLIAGCGYVGQEVARMLTRRGDRAAGLTRSGHDLPPGVDVVKADLLDPQTLAGLPPGLSRVVYCPSATRSDRDLDAARKVYTVGLRNLVEALHRQGHAVQRLVYVSTTGVYAQTDGSWVDEDSPTAPDRPSARYLLEGESIALDSGYPAVVARLAGLYGPGRARLVRAVREGRDAGRRASTAYLNQVHRDDAAGALLHLLDLETPNPVYLVSDTEPAPRRTVLEWIASAAGQPCPAPGDETPAVGGSKRCRCKRLQESGYSFTYPTFREGYAAVLDEESRASAGA